MFLVARLKVPSWVGSADEFAKLDDDEILDVLWANSSLMRGFTDKVSWSIEREEGERPNGKRGG